MGGGRLGVTSYDDLMMSPQDDDVTTGYINKIV